MTPTDVRDRLTHALRLDLIGPDPAEPQISEILNIAPSRWYLTGFLVPWNAPVSQKQDVEDTQGELELGEAGSGGDEDDSTPEPPAARRGHFPSSIGLSVLISGEAQDLRVTARWGDYTPIEKDGKPTGEWQRHEREETVPLRLTGKQANPPPTPVPNGDGLDIITSVRRVRRLENLPGLPKGVLAVSVFLVNGRRAEDRPELKDMRFAFQASLTLDADRPLVSRPNPRGQDPGGDADERIADLQYRDVMEFAVGHGTATRAIVVAGVCRKVATTWMPEAEVERVEPSIMTGVELGMEALAAMPDAASVRAGLAPIVTDYRGWIDTQRAKAPKGGVQGEVADDLLQRAALAASRIEAGLAVLDDPLVLRAFLLTNRAMAAAARQRRAQEQGVQPSAAAAPSWRPFQLAFLLMNLRAFVSPTHADREIVDLLFFPTGGGKTEAYLGLAAFAILLRRLRDPELTSSGVAVLMRYTLRLLTLDQLSRASTLICALELQRQETPETLGAWPFEIGLWVGKAATPNRMGAKGEKDKTTARAKIIRYQSGSSKASPVPLESCPWCGTKLEPTSFRLVPNADEPKNLQLTCRNLSCAFKGKNPLPIIAVDEPLYRRVPCFVIATVDKFASLPWVGPSGMLLGGADRCDAIGFYGAADPGIGQKLAKPLPPPDLIIQDELHLISGPLGTMAGLYETAIDALCERTVNGHTVRPKIIASTATVRRATEQILALFARSGVEVFPPPGPDRRASFFAETVPLAARRGRLYVGLAAQGRSLKVVLLRSYLALLAAAQKAWLEAGGSKNASNPADPFMTLVGYFNSLRELGGSRRIVEDEVASRVSDYARKRRVNDPEGTFVDRNISREVAELTSRESTSAVADTKRRLAVDFSSKDERVDVALATNMISVGLDITRLGLMVVLGQPKAAAEYIQATSRVGRDQRKPGLVVALLNVHKPRDRSHFERFEAFHASFYRAVEATSVTPFAPRALDRGLAAIVVALARHSRAPLAPPRGAIEIVGERLSLNSILEVLSQRARRHRAMAPAEEQRLDAALRGRAQDLLDAWAKIGQTNRGTSSPLRYQSHEGGTGQALLHTPLDPELDTLGKSFAKFTAPRSMRDVEPSVCLWLKRLDGVAIDLAAEGEDN